MLNTACVSVKKQNQLKIHQSIENPCNTQWFMKNDIEYHDNQSIWYLRMAEISKSHIYHEN